MSRVLLRCCMTGPKILPKTPHNGIKYLSDGHSGIVVTTPALYFGGKR
jgi:hypothetical protein